MLHRRRFLKYVAGSAGLAGAGALPAWARSSSDGNLGIPALQGNRFDLTVGTFPMRINGRATEAIGVNGTAPAPLLRFREGEEVTLNVTNTLDTDTSIHWHGLLVPFQMDGVPGVSFPGIKPGETFTYKYAVPQNGTYWYHSHSGLQEQVGHYGPIIIDPKGADPVAYDREYVLVLGDWTFGDPDRLFAKLKKHSDSQNFQQRTVGDFFEDASHKGLGAGRPGDVGRDADVAARSRGCRRADLHLPDQWPVDGGQFQHGVQSGRACAPEDHQCGGHDLVQCPHAGPADDDRPGRWAECAAAGGRRIPDGCGRNI
tara:strand:+ start:447 stop:1388 length:942 start_codon:yes stop_codon:yes gene_type:complete